MGIASFVIGLLTILGACVNLIPGLSWANWILGPVALVGISLGLVCLYSKHENKVFGGIGLALNAIALVIAVLRTILSFAAGGIGIF